MSQRALKFGAPQNKGPLAKLRTLETKFVQKSSYDSKPKQPDNDDIGFEIDFGTTAPKKLFPLKMDKKTTFADFQSRNVKNEQNVQD